MRDEDLFIEYMLDFYGPCGCYSERHFTESEVIQATKTYKVLLKLRGRKFFGDSIDRENVREIVLDFRNLKQEKI